MKNTKKKYWAVVLVESGIPVNVNLFTFKELAYKHEQFLRLDMHLENDETGVFEVNEIPSFN